ncbi:helix-turn-helix domain-containing protein [Streptantibioticus parmotrematis]|uniref:helix-turn-helix domain-containing protein n=1 Tax=Streptantibioticus parmotrematis TaxID=2873249 RepID=UPI003557EFE2
MTQDSRTGAATEVITPSVRVASQAGSGTTTAVPGRKLSARRRKEVVAVLMFSGGPIFESSIPLSVFGVDRQDAGVPRYRLLVCAGEDGPLRTTGGLELSAPYGLDALGRAGTIVVPAWRSISQPPPASALAALRRAHEEGARIIGLCTGAFVLAAAGLLDGRPATTHWMYAPTLAKRYPSVHVDPRELFVDDGDILTSAGTAAGIDLCLHVVRTDHGSDAANALARRLVVPPRRSGGQERYLDRSLPEEIGGDPLAEVVAWALEHLHEQFDVETLAARAYMSRRTFDRRFRSLTGSAPLQWLITQRVLQAQRLLETSDYSVDEVAGRCGFRSPVALRGHFRRQLGSSPASYRTAFRARRPQDPADRADRGADGRPDRPERLERGEGPRGETLPHQRRGPGAESGGVDPGRTEPDPHAIRLTEQHGRADAAELAGLVRAAGLTRLRPERAGGRPAPGQVLGQQAARSTAMPGQRDRPVG